MDELEKKIIDKNSKILIWGVGYIGLSTAIAFAENGFCVKCVDINTTIVEKVNSGLLPVELKVDHNHFRELVNSKLITAIDTDNTGDLLEETDIHIICVNTEKKGLPVSLPIENVIEDIMSKIRHKDTLILIESTIPPSWVDEFILSKLPKHYHIGVAPRRDWFLEEKMDLKTLPRVVGMNQNKYKDIANILYGNLSDNIISVTDAHHASLVKSVENALRYLNIVFTNETMQAYSNYNISEVFAAASTKWNIPHYHPSIGIGGYCLPLAPHYLIEGATNPSALTTLYNAMESDSKISNFITSFINQFEVNNICILGLSYAPNVKIEKSSPAIKLSNELSKKEYNVYMHDPFYTKNEIEEISHAKYINYEIEALKDIDLFIIASSHIQYKNSLKQMLNNLDKEVIVIDNLGEMKELESVESIKYIEVGNFSKV